MPPSAVRRPRPNIMLPPKENSPFVATAALLASAWQGSKARFLAATRSSFCQSSIVVVLLVEKPRIWALIIISRYDLGMGYCIMQFLYA